MIGDEILHYRILSKLGKGGMGEVYLAEDEKLGRRVALKVLPESLAANPSHLERFRREARAVAALDHPNIVTLHAVEEADGIHFLTMSLVEGKPLTELIPPRGMEPRGLLEIAVPLADALATAHAKGITHRDLKPSNVMVTHDGQVKVLDFGLAKLGAPAGAPTADTSDLETPLAADRLTVTGTILGTAPYMSPEQIRGEAADHRSDVFSFGVLLYEMAIGRRPFTGDDRASLASAILRDEPPAVSAVRPAHSTRFSRIVKRCLAKDPVRRFQSTLDLRNELEELAADLDSGAEPAPFVAAEELTRTHKRRLPWWIAVAGVVVAVVAYSLLRPAGPASTPTIAGFEQLTPFPAQELFPSLSPNGSDVAYASDATGDWDLYVLRVGGDNPRNLTNDPDADDYQPAFSPDGQSIAFSSTRDGGGLFVMGATGESVRRLADEGFNPDWSPDGRHIVYGTGEPIFGPYGRGAHSELWIVEVETGERRRLVADGAQPRWSPNGHRVAYWAIPDGNRELFTVSADGGDPIAVAASEHYEWSPAWSADGRWLYFSSDRGGSMNLWRIALDERTGEALGEPEPVTHGAAEEVWHATFSRSGDLAVYATYLREANIQRAALGPGARTLGEPTWFTQGSIPYRYPSISRDGRITYRSGDDFDIFVSDLDGDNRVQLTDDPFRNGWPRWSPSDDRIAFFSNHNGPTQIFTIRPDGTDLEQVTHTEPRDVIRPAWSPDGSKLAFSGTADPETSYRAYVVDLTLPWDEQEIYEVPIPEDMDWFQTHSWSPDGERLAGISSRGEGGEATVFSLIDQSFEVVPRTGESVRHVQWLHDGNTLIWSSSSTIGAVDTSTGEQWQLLSVRPDEIYGFGITPDGAELFFDRSIVRADLWAIRMETE